MLRLLNVGLFLLALMVLNRSGLCAEESAKPAEAEDAESKEVPVYELRTYVCEPGKLDALHARFRDHTMRLFEKHGMKNIAYWTPIDGPASETTLIYILEHASREAAAASWDGFRNDPEWMEVRKKSEEAGKILAQPPDSVFLGATEYSPAVAAVDSEKTYELRVYEVTEGRMERLNNRFRDVTTAYFNKHGITSVAYWLPLDEPASQNKLYYILQFDSHDDAKAKWKSLSGDQEWKAAFAATQPDGSLVKGRPASIYMRPTDYSPRPVATE